MNTPAILKSERLTYAYWTEAQDPSTQRQVPGLGAHSFSIFDKPTRPRMFELHRTATERGGQPDRVTLEAFTHAEPKGKIIFDGSLPWKDEVARVKVETGPVLAVSQRCHWKHPVPVSHHELHPSPWVVPFNIFETTVWHGIPDTSSRLAFPERPALRSTTCAPFRNLASKRPPTRYAPSCWTVSTQRSSKDRTPVPNVSQWTESPPATREHSPTAMPS